MKTNNQHLIVGLDIGTTKVCAIVGELNDNNELEIIGIGNHPSHGLKKGVVVNIDKTVESIKSAVEEAERMAGCEIQNVIVGIAGSHIKGISGHGMITLRSKEVTKKDVDRVIESANAMTIPTDREILHVLPQEYTIDGESGVKDPIGIYGVKLEADVHIVTAQVTATQNLVKCIHLSGMDVSDVVLEQIASSEAVLTEDEKEIGTVLIDIGGGTCDIAIFSGGTIRYTENNLTVGGDQLDRDLAMIFNTPLTESKKLKEKYGVALTEKISCQDLVEVERISGGKPGTVPRGVLAEILEERMEEIFKIIRTKINKSGYDFLPAGAVITGGSVKMEGTEELAGKVLKMPVRIGIPSQIGGLSDIIANPIYSTGVGLVQYGYKYNSNNKIYIKESNAFGKVFDRMKNWFQEFF